MILISDAPRQTPKGEGRWGLRLAREFQLLSARKAPLTKTNDETRTGYEPGPGAPRRERRASPPKYRAGTVSPLTPATRGRLKPSRFAASSSVFGRRNAWGSMKMESVQTGWA